jgi:hypothetical protein
MKVQLNHPGTQKSFKIGKGYINIGNDIVIREWNNDKEHYRKFLQHNGYFIIDVSDNVPKYDELFFWGEWEGNSFFKNLNNRDVKKLPNGIHKPFHSTQFRGIQNTDPYIFGDAFKYCICRQKGQLTRLVLDDLILFGTVVPSLNKFYIDTVFVIKSSDPSTDVQASNGVDYSTVYKEETLEQLYEYLKPATYINDKKLYKSKTWWDDSNYFSFVPVKLKSDENGFERLFIDLNSPLYQLSNNSQTAFSYLKRCKLSAFELWKEIIEKCNQQNFYLGLRFDEPELNDCLENVNIEKTI